MKILSTLINLFKGGDHAGRTEKSVSGGDGRERRILHSIPSIRERAISDICGIRMLATACADERSRDTGQMPPDPIRRESNALTAAAKRTGCFVEKASIPGTRYTIRTGESEVRLVQREQLYYKVKNPFSKLHLKKHPPEYVLFDHVIHNILFPDCRLEFLGVAEEVHEARLVFRQKAVRSDARPDDRQISGHLGRLGLRSEGRYAFANDYVIVTDVGQDGDNVLLDDDGQLRFIDPILGFKQPLLQELSAALVDESAISQLVYKLYGLTDEEIAVVEGRGESNVKSEESRTVRASANRRNATVVETSQEEEELA